MRQRSVKDDGKMFALVRDAYGIYVVRCGPEGPWLEQNFFGEWAVHRDADLIGELDVVYDHEFLAPCEWCPFSEVDG